MENKLFWNEDLEIIAEYLERLGVEGLRQPYRPDRINKRAVIRYLIAEKLQEALVNPPEPEGQRHRAGQVTQKRKPSTITDTQTRKRS